MLKYRLLFFTFFIAFLQVIQAQTILVPFESDWKYQDLGAEPTEQGNDKWFAFDYNDDNWQEGPAQLGYGDDDETTEVGDSVYTSYFRHAFQVIEADSYQLIDMEILFDDGAVVYLNGEEVWRVNMPSGNISYNTYASGTSSENETRSKTISSGLIEGTNVIAVEVHQKGASSSDMSFDFQLSAIHIPTEIIRGPYLQKASPTSMLIKWRTSVPTEYILEYGTSITNLDQISVLNGNPETDHEVELEGLIPNTIYYYKISTPDEVLFDAHEAAYFKTSPENDSIDHFSFWLLGDCGTANEEQRLVRDAFYSYSNNTHLDGILFLGDNAYEDGKDEEYQYALFENMYEDRLKNTVSWSCLGNHDALSASSEDQSGPYYEIFSLPKNGESGGLASGTEAYYSFDYGNIHFICLDSHDSDRSVGAPMYEWCENDLQNTMAEWIIAFWHHPPYSSGDKNSDTDTEQKEMRNYFLPLLEANGVDLVVTGHSHTYQRSYLLNGHYGKSESFNCKTHTVGPLGNADGQIDGAGAYEKVSVGSEAEKGAVYVVTGSAGKQTNSTFDHPAMYYAIDQLGSCILEVEGNQLDLKFIRETGEIDDYFTIIKDPVTCTDWDEDGYCMDTDPDDMDACNPDVNSYLCVPYSIITADDFEEGYGNWKDGGSDCTMKSKNAYSGSYSVRLRDDSGAESSLISKRLDLTEYLEVSLAFTYYPEDMEDGESFVLEVSPDGGDNYSVYREWEKDEDFENEIRYFEEVLICDNYLTEDTRIRIRCKASSNSDYIFIDDVILKGLTINCTAGTPCDDGDPCTQNSVLDGDCNCTGGSIIDLDEDGYCNIEDPDDLDPCIPDEQAPGCIPCFTVLEDDFESGFGNWNDGGDDCFLSDQYAYSGISTILLIDNAEESSSTYTNSLDLSGYTSAKVIFTFYAFDMEYTEDFFLEVSVNDGDDYTIVEDWIAGQDFENKTRYFDTISIDNIVFSENTRFRFRCDAHSNQDFIYLDDVSIIACSGATSHAENTSGEALAGTSASTSTEVGESQAGFQIFPNPAVKTTFVRMDVGLEDEAGTIMVYNLQGILMAELELKPGEAEIRELDIRRFPSGIYTLYLKRPGKKFIVEKMVVLND